MKRPILANGTEEEKSDVPAETQKPYPHAAPQKEHQNNIWFPQHLFILLYIRKLSSTFPRYKSVPGSERRGLEAERS